MPAGPLPGQAFVDSGEGESSLAVAPDDPQRLLRPGVVAEPVPAPPVIEPHEAEPRFVPEQLPNPKPKPGVARLDPDSEVDQPVDELGEPLPESRLPYGHTPPLPVTEEPDPFLEWKKRQDEETQDLLLNDEEFGTEAVPEPAFNLPEEEDPFLSPIPGPPEAAEIEPPILRAPRAPRVPLDLTPARD